MSSSYGEELETGPAARSGTAPVPHPTPLLCVDRAQSPACKGLRGHHRLCTRLPLRRVRHAARASDSSCFMTFETDSKKIELVPKEIELPPEEHGHGIGS